MNKDLQEYANKAFKIGQISGIAYVTECRLANILKELTFNTEVDNYVVDKLNEALEGIKEINKLSRQI